MLGKYPWLEEYLKNKPGVTDDFKVEWQWYRFMVGNKMFAALMHPSAKYDLAYAEKDLLNLKCDPMLSELLRKEHAEILPGFYSDKRCWVSGDLGGALTDNALKVMVDESYELVYGKRRESCKRR
ncbi:MAG: MmcQ/YjbR family DNA-binding protein [Oscillospiraceae bacterium]